MNPRGESDFAMAKVTLLSSLAAAAFTAAGVAASVAAAAIPAAGVAAIAAGGPVLGAALWLLPFFVLRVLPAVAACGARGHGAAPSFINDVLRAVGFVQGYGEFALRLGGGGQK